MWGGGDTAHRRAEKGATLRSGTQALRTSPGAKPVLGTPSLRSFPCSKERPRIAQENKPCPAPPHASRIYFGNFKKKKKMRPEIGKAHLAGSRTQHHEGLCSAKAREPGWTKMRGGSCFPQKRCPSAKPPGHCSKHAQGGRRAAPTKADLLILAPWWKEWRRTSGTHRSQTGCVQSTSTRSGHLMAGHGWLASPSAEGALPAGPPPASNAVTGPTASKDPPLPAFLLLPPPSRPVAQTLSRDDRQKPLKGSSRCRTTRRGGGG